MREVARRSRDGGRENALQFSPPASLSLSSPLVRGGLYEKITSLTNWKGQQKLPFLYIIFVIEFLCVFSWGLFHPTLENIAKVALRRKAAFKSNLR